VTHPVDRALDLWSRPPAEGEAGLAAFRTVFTDPLDLNGTRVPLQLLVDRARDLHRALADLDYEIVERLDAPGRSAFAFWLSGRHVGPLRTPLGEVAPTGRRLEVLTMDIFMLTGDLVSGVWAVSDELGRLVQADAVALTGAPDL
jgi:hypothetical protein